MATDSRGQRWMSCVKRVVSRAPRVLGVVALAVLCNVVPVRATDNGVGQVLADSGAASAPLLTVAVIADGEQRVVTTEPVTVAELLAAAGIALGELDRVNRALDDVVADGDTVRVERVRHERVVREIEIPVRTVARYDRRVGRPVTVRQGAPGLARVALEVWTKEGVETQCRVISQQVVKPMTPEVVVRGAWRLPARGGRVLYLEATGYDPGPRSCGRYASGRTAIGLRAGRGVVAVDPRVIPLGTRLHVEGYGECIAGDVGSAINGRRIDLGFDTYREALAWGRRTVKVTVLD